MLCSHNILLDRDGKGLIADFGGMSVVWYYNTYVWEYTYIQSTPLNRDTSVPGHFDLLSGDPN